MACPTCSATMALLCIAGNGTYYHCPRCGTIRRATDVGHEDYVPKLVERCRQYQRKAGTVATLVFWHRLGIAESIGPPAEQRPK